MSSADATIELRACLESLCRLLERPLPPDALDNERVREEIYDSYLSSEADIEQEFFDLDRVGLPLLLRCLAVEPDRTLTGNFVMILIESDFYDEEWDIAVEPGRTRRAMFAAPALDVGFVRDRLREIDALESRSFENTDDLAVIGTELADASPWLEAQLAYRTRNHALLTYLANHAAEPGTRAYVKRRLVFF